MTHPTGTSPTSKALLATSSDFLMKYSSSLSSSSSSSSSSSLQPLSLSTVPREGLL
eukprot:CAMPEP_0197175212 /NCGR_PEP_ID=MMETSP1423-20130617/1494_1 /TAXON_ID=476441 /ORGANISM="Pseudo-nitzschia heimii, Strain UNC1101" /LENGTH=55 /DNA_ID=CAMNT_0042624313 /DNA_START=857 /DNA_END=1020 /DNA_ORIENTATION=-